MYLKFILSLFLYGIYSYYTYTVGSLVLPFTISMVAGVFLVVRDFRLPKNFYYFFFAISIFLVLVTTISYSYGEIFFFDKIKSLLVFEYSLFFSLYYLRDITRFSNQSLANYFLWATVVVLLLSIFHLLSPAFQHFQEDMLENFYGKKLDFEHLLNRDVLQHGGFMRPFPFTSEPSHVGKFLFVSWTSWLLLSDRKRYVLFFAMSFLIFGVVRSPSILPLFFVGVVSLLQKDSLNNITSLLYKFVFLLFSLFVLIFIFIISYNLFSTRLGMVASGTDISTMYRVVLPFYFAITSISESPLWGIGIGNLEYMVSVYNNSGYRLFYVPYSDNTYYLNDMLSPIVYFGFLGTFIFYYLLVYFFRVKRQNFNISIFFLCFLTLSNTVGNFHGIIFWAYVATTYRACIFVKIKS